MKKLLIASALCLMTVPAFAGWFSESEVPDCGDEVIKSTFHDIIMKELQKDFHVKLISNQNPNMQWDWTITLEHTREFQGYDAAIGRRFCEGEASILLKDTYVPEAEKRAFNFLFLKYMMPEPFSIRYTVSKVDEGSYVQIITQ